MNTPASNDATSDALAIFAKLTPGHLAYALRPHGHDSIGFAALHDFCDANMLLPAMDEVETLLEEEERTGHRSQERLDALTDRANAAMEAFNRLLLENNWEHPKMLEARALVKADKVPALTDLRAPFCDPLTLACHRAADAWNALTDEEGPCPMDEEFAAIGATLALPGGDTTLRHLAGKAWLAWENYETSGDLALDSAMTALCQHLV